MNTDISIVAVPFTFYKGEMQSRCSRIASLTKYRRIGSAMADDTVPDTYCVYKITHIASAMAYFGVTSRPEVRFKQHFQSCGAPRLYEAMRRDGLHAFHFEIIAQFVTRRQACKSERGFVRQENTIWPNGFNLQAGGNGTLTPNLPQETRRALSENARRYHDDPENHKAHIERSRSMWAGEKGEARRQRMKERWQDEEFRERSLSGLRRAQDERWNGAEAIQNRAEVGNRTSRMNRERWTDQNYASRMVAMLHDLASNPSDETRKKMSVSAKARKKPKASN